MSWEKGVNGWEQVQKMGVNVAKQSYHQILASVPPPHGKFIVV